MKVRVAAVHLGVLSAGMVMALCVPSAWYLTSQTRGPQAAAVPLRTAAHPVHRSPQAGTAAAVAAPPQKTPRKERVLTGAVESHAPRQPADFPGSARVSAGN